ncbi:hypothetical protein CTEN210_13579 [Chaetoceros tenuissimus]|uniref:Leucine-rich repeat domain-containing protein n=1 Tax=Chaetoceros tenuissimus TaxID=426638 RepID=A0AAD3D3J8_9STRA|nr:hypothetical protein CTEN210_13579 [Chaetoceros tenuissimus]
MRQQRKLTNKEWKEISEKYKDGGVHTYRGKRTLFYNGEKLVHVTNELFLQNEEYLIYSKEERDSWEVIIVLPGVEVIPECTFDHLNIEKVIMADTIRRIEYNAFFCCESLKFVQLSTSLEYIGRWAFGGCLSLISIFIPPSCREIDGRAFFGCRKLIILTIPRHTQLGENAIGNIALIKASPFETNRRDEYDNNDEVNEWIKGLNQNEEFALHRECATYEPSENAIFEIVKHQGLRSIHVKNQIGLTGFEYLQKNPYTDIELDQQKLINRLVLDLMGEIIA